MPLDWLNPESPWVQVAGRLHLLLLHAPIVLLILAAILEILYVGQRDGGKRGVGRATAVPTVIERPRTMVRAEAPGGRRGAHPDAAADAAPDRVGPGAAGRAIALATAASHAERMGEAAAARAAGGASGAGGAGGAGDRLLPSPDGPSIDASVDVRVVVERPGPPARRSVLPAVLGSLGAIAAAATGWIHADVDFGADPALLWHRWTGVATGGLAMLVLIAAIAVRVAPTAIALVTYRGGLLLAAVLVGVTGHLGGSLVHGEGFVLAPLRAADADLSAPILRPADERHEVRGLRAAPGGLAPGASTSSSGPNLLEPSDGAPVDVPPTGDAAPRDDRTDVGGAPIAEGDDPSDDAARDAARADGPPDDADADSAGVDAGDAAGAADAADAADPGATAGRFARLARFDQVAEILDTSCIRCHGPRRQRGDVRLDDEAAVRATVVPGDPDASLLVQLVELPPDDPRHMPKGGEPLSREAITMIRAWVLAIGATPTATATTDPVAETSAGPNRSSIVDANAVTDGGPHDDATADATPRAAEPSEPAVQNLPPRPAARRIAPVIALDADARAARDTAIRRLRDLGILATVRRAESDGVEVRVVEGRDDFDDAALRALRGLEPCLEVLDLTGTAVTDAGFTFLASFTRMRHLRAGRTRLGDEALAAMTAWPDVEILDLHATDITRDGLERLLARTEPARIHVWATGITSDDLEELQRRAPSVQFTGLDATD